MDKDRIVGAAKTVAGNIKEFAGTVLGDQKIAAEGKALKQAGKVQNAIGGTRDAAEKTRR